MYLGYVISSFGISADTSNVEAVNSFPVPKNLKQLCLFNWDLMIVNLYGVFSRIANSLFILTTKDVPNVWSSDCQKAFDELKDRLIKALVLVSINL